MEQLNDRRKRILFAVISEYVMTADPVGSRTISKRYQLELSPATIRNVMSDLEELGFFYQPHTSSGRVPTDKAFRFYIEELAQFRPLDQQVERELRERTRSLEDLRTIVTESSKALSEISSYAAVGVMPRIESTTFKHIQFVRLSARQLLVVFVTGGNVVHNRVATVDKELSQSELDRMSNYLNDLLAGLTISQCRDKLLGEMQDVRKQYDEILKRAVEMGAAAIGDSQGQVIIEGGSRMLHEPEFGDLERARSLFRAFEEKSIMLKLLDKALSTPGVNIWMGSDTDEGALENCAVVTGTYGAEGQTMGTVGIIGPMRMDYGKVVPLVEYTSKMISRQLANLQSGGQTEEDS